MTDQQPHPQRCETCGHRDADRSQYPPAEYSCYCNLKRMWVHMYCNDWIGYVGCASHSSVSEPVAEKCEYPEDCRRPADCPETRIARQQEREKVLDEALAEFQNINAPPVRVTYIRHVLESLRQQEEQR